MLVILPFLLGSLPAYATTEISDGSVEALYHLDTDGADASGNGYTLTESGSPTYAAGKINNATTLSATNYFDGGDVLDFDYNEPFSLSVWMQSNTLATQSIIAKHRMTPNYDGWSLRIYDNGGLKVLFQLMNNASTNAINVESTDTVASATEFYHIMVTYDGSNSASGVNMWINGKSQSLTVYSDTLSTTTTNNVNLNVGYRDNSAQQFVGQLDELVVFNVEVASTTIDALYNAGAGDDVCTEVGCTSEASSGITQVIHKQNSKTWTYLLFFSIVAILMLLIANFPK